MYALIAAIPIFLTVILMVGFNWPAKRALPASWLIACFVAGFIWKMGILEIGAQTLAGFLSAFETLAIIFGAILLMNVLKQSGAMASINNIFSNITKDARIWNTCCTFCSNLNLTWIPTVGSSCCMFNLQLYTCLPGACRCSNTDSFQCCILFRNSSWR